MRINGPSRPVQTGSAGAGRKTDGSGAAFPPVGQAGTREAAPLSGAGTTATLAGLDALMALQGVDADDQKGRGRRRTVRRGHDLLDTLEEMRIALLGGQVSPSMLDRLALLLAGLERTGDSRLDALMDDIALRAEVELAKRGRFLSGR